MTQCLSFSTKSISLIENCQGRLAERCSKFWKTISWSKVQDTNAYKPETPVTKATMMLTKSISRKFTFGYSGNHQSLYNTQLH